MKGDLIRENSSSILACIFDWNVHEIGRIYTFISSENQVDAFFLITIKVALRSKIISFLKKYLKE